MKLVLSWKVFLSLAQLSPSLLQNQRKKKKKKMFPRKLSRKTRRKFLKQKMRLA